MLGNWRMIAPGDYFTLPSVERQDGKVSVYVITKMEATGWVHYRNERNFFEHTCTLGWLIDNAIELL